MLNIKVGPETVKVRCPGCSLELSLPVVIVDGARVTYLTECERCGHQGWLDGQVLRPPPYRVRCVDCDREHVLDWEGPRKTVTVCPACGDRLLWEKAQVWLPRPTEPAAPAPAFDGGRAAAEDEGEECLVPCKECYQVMLAFYFEGGPFVWKCSCGGELDWDRRVKVDRAA